MARKSSSVAPQPLREALASWAGFHGLEQTDALLPAASDRLHLGTERIAPEASFYEGGPDDPVKRPGRFSEGTFAGTLPGGLVGEVGHHSYLKSRLRAGGRGSTDSVMYVEPLTAVVVWAPDAGRATRELRWTKEDGWAAAVEGDPNDDLPPRDQLDDAKRAARVAPWKANVRWEPAPKRLQLPRPKRLPEDSTITARDGYLVVEAPAYLEDPSALCRTAADVASALGRTAERLPRLEAGDGLPQETPLADMPPVEWERPPADTAEAVAAYMDAGRDATRTKGPFGRALKHVGVNVMKGIGEHVEFARWWGLEAFAHEYAAANGMQVSDRDELRRRIAMPIPGHARRTLQGRLAGGIEGHLALWEDPTVASQRRVLDVAIVLSHGRGEPRAPDGFEAWRVEGWIVVGREVGEEGNSSAGLEAVAEQAGRLA